MTLTTFIDKLNAAPYDDFALINNSRQYIGRLIRFKHTNKELVIPVKDWEQLNELGY